MPGARTSRPDNTMGSVYGTAETLLDVYGDPTLAASADGCNVDLTDSSRRQQHPLPQRSRQRARTPRPCSNCSSVW
jgi:hypothetical protein